jgi:hypothetical protein
MNSKTLGGLVIAGALAIGAPAALALASPNGHASFQGAGDVSAEAPRPPAPDVSTAADAAQQTQAPAMDTSGVASVTSHVRVPQPQPHVTMTVNGNAVHNAGGSAAATARAATPRTSGQTTTTVERPAPAPRPANGGSSSTDDAGSTGAAVSVNGGVSANL